MSSISQQLTRLEEFQTAYAALERGKSPVLVTGLAPVHKALFAHALVLAQDRGALIVTQDEQSAVRLTEDLNRLYRGAQDIQAPPQGAQPAPEPDAPALPQAWHYPEREWTLRQVEGVSREYEHLRLAALDQLLTRPGAVVVASAAAALQRTLPPDILARSTRTVSQGEGLSQEELIRHLVWSGYTRSHQVEGVCQFAARGGILDLYPPGHPQPVRIEFWGDEVDTISRFSVETQRREEPLEEVRITPAREGLYLPQELAQTLERQLEKLPNRGRAAAHLAAAPDLERLHAGEELPSADRYLPLLYPGDSCLLSYLEDRLLLVCEGIAVRESAKFCQWQEEEDVKALLEEGAIPPMADRLNLGSQVLEDRYHSHPTLLLDSFPRSYPGLKLGELCHLEMNTLSVWSGQLDPLVEDLDHYLRLGYCVYVLGGTRRGALALVSDLEGRGIPARFTQELELFERGKVLVAPGSLSTGFEHPRMGLACITYGKGALTGAPRKKKRPREGRVIRDIADLTPGDHVVHVTHGIGVFGGIVKREIQGIVKDYIKINYAGTDTLFVPVTQLDLVTKYIGGREDGGVKLSRLNSGEWSKTRQRVKKAVSDMAKELIALYAKRMSVQGYAYSPDSDWQREFEEKFEYQETDDQLRCIQEIKGDMERGTPMDRLLCGDVGFGKTEVALRGIFKAVLDGKQCAVMAPTTILAWQHYQTFLRRLEGYPVKVELLSRFRTPKQQREVLRGLKSGEVDLVVGTHKLVQKDVEFHDLGLCVIDEEQRFGVAHKERFKELRATVDVLTLSATPIPRTLNMAMSGIRDMSVIEEAPHDRHPVQTYVLEYNEEILLEAIRRELRRDGQVFYLHNRVGTIETTAARLRERLPDARIATAHGKMGEEALSRVWQQLVQGELDILVCTTIVEAGVDVTNCNTLIIEDADHLGLSQLYQLRGRVGRGSRRAYAYFTFRRGKVLTEVGEKRLSAIREFTAFGSGFRIAMRDLEIRGAGDILGSQQHGHMEAVGYDLYLKLLGEAIAEEKGEPAGAAAECLVDVQLEAHIPEDYIDSLAQRIDIYKKIASVYTREDYMDTLDELIDRFGEPPQAVVGLLEVALVRNGAAALGIREISQRGPNLLFYPQELDMEKTAALVQAMKGRVLLSAGQTPYLTVRPQKGQSPLDTIREVIRGMGGAGEGFTECL